MTILFSTKCGATTHRLHLCGSWYQGTNQADIGLQLSGLFGYRRSAPDINLIHIDVQHILMLETARVVYTPDKHQPCMQHVLGAALSCSLARQLVDFGPGGGGQSVA